MKMSDDNNTSDVAHCFASDYYNESAEITPLCQSHPKNLQQSINESLEYTSTHEGIYIHGENKSTNHQIYEMNEFYIEMVKRLQKLKLDYVEEDELMEDGICGGDGDSVLSEVVNAIKKKRNDPEIKKQIETILKLDLEIEQNYKTLKDERFERESIEDQLYTTLKQETELDKNSEKLYQLYKFEAENRRQNFEKEAQQTQAEPEKLGESSCKKKEKSQHNKFIRRNIELAKNSQEMGNLSLTDEEKVKLESLLVDVDSVVDDGTTVVITEDTDPHCTGYHFDDDERCLLDALDERLKEFGKYEESFEEIERNSGDDKFWKIEQRLRNIEEELVSYQKEKDKTSEDGNEKFEVAPNLLKCLPEIESMQNMSEMAMRLVECYESEYGRATDNLLEEEVSSDLVGEEVEKYDLEIEDAEEDKLRQLDEYYDEDEIEIVRRVRETKED